MALYPKNTRVPQQAQSHVPGIQLHKMNVSRYHGAVNQAVADAYVTVQDMIVGEYTLASASPVHDFARNVTVTHVSAGTTDTLGTIVVVGKDLAGDEIEETITVVADNTAEGELAFAEITSITGVGWAIDGVEASEDQITVGYGDVVGLPITLPFPTVIWATIDDDEEDLADAEFSSSLTVLSENTVEFDTALSDAVLSIYFMH